MIKRSPGRLAGNLSEYLARHFGSRKAGRPAERARERKQPWRMPAAWLYYPAALVAYLASTLFLGVRVHRDPAIRRVRGPVVVIGNHASFLDPFYMAVALFPRRINYLTSHRYFRSRFIGFCLRKLGAIAKVQFRTDMQAMRNMLGVIHRGGILGIYPEGQRSIDGSSQPLDEAMAKMIYKLRCPVITVIERGAYLTWPRWSQSGIRPGRIEISTRLLFTPKQLEGLDVAAVSEKIGAALEYQDYEWQRKVMHPYHSRAPALGLHNVCHKCPSCGRDLAMQSSRQELACRFCGNTVRMDKFSLLQPQNLPAAPASPDSHISQNPPLQSWPDPYQWHRWQVENLAGQVSRAEFELAFLARLEFPADDGTVEPGGRGLLRLKNCWLEFFPLPGIAAPGGQQSPSLKMAACNLSGVSAHFGRFIEIFQSDRTCRFVLDEGQAVILLVDAIAAVAAGAAAEAAQA